MGLFADVVEFLLGGEVAECFLTLGEVCFCLLFFGFAAGCFDNGEVFVADFEAPDDDDGECDDEAEVEECVNVFHDGWFSMCRGCALGLSV